MESYIFGVEEQAMEEVLRSAQGVFFLNFLINYHLIWVEMEFVMEGRMSV